MVAQLPSQRATLISTRDAAAQRLRRRFAEADPVVGGDRLSEPKPSETATEVTELPPSPASMSARRARSSRSALRCAIGVVSRKRRNAICNARALTPAARATSVTPIALAAFSSRKRSARLTEAGETEVSVASIVPLQLCGSPISSADASVAAKRTRDRWPSRFR